MTTNRPAATAPTAVSWQFAETFVPESDAARSARDSAADLGISAVSRGTAALLTVLARGSGARTIVEIGTGTGVSGLALTAGLPADGVLTSIDSEADQQVEARRVFQMVGLQTRQYRLITGAPTDILPNLRDAAYDLVFVDGDKFEYVEYVDQALRLLRPGGMLVVDNALWGNRVPDTDDESDEAVIIREALDLISSDDDVTASLLTVGDGVVVAVKHA